MVQISRSIPPRSLSASPTAALFLAQVLLPAGWNTPAGHILKFIRLVSVDRNGRCRDHIRQVFHHFIVETALAVRERSRIMYKTVSNEREMLQIPVIHCFRACETVTSRKFSENEAKSRV